MILTARGIEISLDKAFNLDLSSMNEEEIKFALQENRLIRKILTRTRKQLIASNKELKGVLHNDY